MCDRQAFITTSYKEIERLYTPLDQKDMDFEIEIGFPVNTQSDEDSTYPCNGRE
jgi:hypothetical protein